MKPPLVILAGGGTAGSLMPLIAVADEWRRRNAQARILFITTTSQVDSRLLAGTKYDHVGFPAGKWRRYLDWRNVTDLAMVLAAFLRACILLGRKRPCVLISAGGFVAVPLVWAAACWRIPVLVHHQDVRPSLANRITIPFARTVTVALPGMEQRWLAGRRRVVWTGNPIRPGLLAGNAERARRRFGFPAGQPCVLILGGSTGAAGLNEMVLSFVATLAQRASIIHVFGDRPLPTRAAPPHTIRVRFLGEELADVLALADVVITRAGLSTLSELAILGKPTIVVPLPDSHQEDNASYFAEHNAAAGFHQQTQGAEDLLALVQELLGDHHRQRTLAQAIRALNRPDAAKRVADELERLLVRNHESL